MTVRLAESNRLNSGNDDELIGRPGGGRYISRYQMKDATQGKGDGGRGKLLSILMLLVRPTSDSLYAFYAENFGVFGSCLCFHDKPQTSGLCSDKKRKS